MVQIFTRFLLISIFFSVSTFSLANDTNETPINETAEVQALTLSMLSAINDRDADKVLAVFSTPSAQIFGTINGKFNGEYSEAQNTAKGLADFIRTFEGKVEEVFDTITVQIVSPGRAIVKTKYLVTINDEKSHKGEELYSAVKTKEGWKFISLLFTMERP